MKSDFVVHARTWIPYGLFAVLFAWLSFFPPSVHYDYELYYRTGLFVFFCVIALCSKGKKQLFSIRDWPLWFFLVSLSGNLIIAPEKGVALRCYLYLAYNLFMLFYIGKGVFLDEKLRGMVGALICIFSVFVAILGILETWFAFNPVYFYFIDNAYYERYISDIVRPMSTLMNPAVLGTYLLLSFPFGIYLFNQKARTQKVLGFCFLVVTGTCLLLTFSRGAVLGAMALLVFYRWLKKDFKRLFVYGLILGLVLIGMAFLPYPFSRFSVGTLLHGNVLGLFSSYRVARLEMVLQMLAQSPVVGIGLEHIRILFQMFYPLKDELLFIGSEHRIADNMHLTLIAETGILGTVGFFVFISSLFRSGWRRLKQPCGENMGLMLAMTLSALAGLLVNMTGYEIFYWYNPYMFFCLICGFIQGLIDSSAQEAS